MRQFPRQMDEFFCGMANLYKAISDTNPSVSTPAFTPPFIPLLYSSGVLLFTTGIMSRILSSAIARLCSCFESSL
ncbi:hypothetical protein I8748_08470 [Nostoc sp. CENA67]|uniref:Uncharacterized protein n=1 Tax=Amazonocrinis nigriterrae CENA67 TaxID=2794033 RepID=A0A8J7L7E4_9NOST|nr:hypothetical protein [Amazonocrinis nigriterrae]MBH8562208.1 hypothetical protein [Amazonocrinis nigriterrae CENA67]